MQKYLAVENAVQMLSKEEPEQQHTEEDPVKMEWAQVICLVT